MRRRHLVVIIIILLLIVQFNHENLSIKSEIKNSNARSSLECSEYFFEINEDLPIDAGFLIEDSDCVALIINGMTGMEKLDFNIIGDSNYPIDFLIMDDGVYYTYLNEQQYHINPLSGNYLIEKNPSIENLTGNVDFTWSVPSGDTFVIVLDNMRHLADEDRGAGGGDSVSISVLINPTNENWIWTPYNSIIQLESNEKIIFNSEPLYFDEGDAITIRSSQIFGSCDIYLMTNEQFNLYESGSPGIWNIPDASMLDISDDDQIDWIVTSEFANIPLNVIIDNQNNPAGGGDGGTKMAATISILVNPVLSPSIEIKSHNSSTIEIDEIIEFDAGNTPNTWGQIKDYNWNIENFDNISASTASAKWDEPGEYLVQLEIIRSDQEKASKNITITVLDIINPVIKISGVAENALIEQNSVQTIMCECIDNHEIKDIQWFINSQKVSESESSFIIPTSNLGEYNLKIILTDLSGNSAEKYLNYTIVDATDPELISVNWPEGDIIENKDLVFKIQASDPEDPNLIFRWDFDLSLDSDGDGNKRNDWVEGIYDSSNNEAKITHSYSSAGTYTIMVQVINSENRKLELTYSIAVSNEESTDNQSLIYYSAGIITLLLLVFGGILTWKNIQKRITKIEAEGKNLTPEELAEIKQKEISQRLYGSDQNNLEGIANMGVRTDQWDPKISENKVINQNYKSNSNLIISSSNVGADMLNALIENENDNSKVSDVKNDLAFLEDVGNNKKTESKPDKKINEKKSTLKIDIPGMTAITKNDKKTLQIDLPTIPINSDIKNDDFDI